LEIPNFLPVGLHVFRRVPWQNKSHTWGSIVQSSESSLSNPASINARKAFGKIRIKIFLGYGWRE